MALARAEAAPDVASPLAADRRAPYFLVQLVRRRTALFGLVIVCLVVLMAVFAPLIAPYDPLAQDVPHKFETPSLAHPFGRDQLGRDLLSRLIYGSRTSLQVGVFAVGFAAVAGVTLGMVSGYFGGLVEMLIMRVMDALLAFPGLLLTIAIAASLGTGLEALVIAVGVSATPHFARVMRGSVLGVKQLDYVQAAKVLGASDLRIMARHIWPNSLQPLIVQTTLGIGGGILVGAGASFLGVGVQPPTADWGQMINSSQQYVFTHWWLSMPPGIAILLTVLGFNLLGDGLRDALDPRLRGVL